MIIEFIKMYKTEMSYEEFLKREQEKNPELNIEDIDLLKKRVEANVDLPPVPGIRTILSHLTTHFLVK